MHQLHNGFCFLGTYFAAVIENRTDFTGRVVVDVGAGSGILSLFAAQVQPIFFYQEGLLCHMVVRACFLFECGCLYVMNF